MLQAYVMHVFRRFIDLILPATCSYCRETVGDSAIPFFCTTCWNDFSAISGPACPHCGKPFESPETLTHSPDHECSSCRQTPPQCDQIVSVGYYEGTLREAIHQFKYRPCRSLGKPLAQWMLNNIRLVSGLDCIMPVPLHRKRLRQRGFNQALLLSHAVSDAYGIRLSIDNLLRIRYTRPQVELSGQERIANVEGAFSLHHPQDINGANILLVDDVFTTGSTINECSKVLKKAGAERVNALTLARAF